MIVGPERLHVIRCYERLPPLPGGMERHIAELTAAQRALGVRVTELFNRGEPAGEAVQLWRGRAIDQLRPHLLRSMLFYGSAALRSIDRSDGRLTVVHVHGDWPAFLFGSIFARRVGANAMAATLHSTSHASIGRYASALRSFDPIFTTGATQARLLARALGRPVVHLPSAPAEHFFDDASPAPASVDVIAVGSLVPVKNIDLILACAALRRDASFAVVGGGPEEVRLRQKAGQLGLNNVSFFGALPIDEVRTKLRSARIFLNTSHTEGSPTAALEAMACGLPVVLTPSNDYSGLVEDGVSGRILQGWDVEEVASAIDWFLSDDKRLARAGAAARRTAEQHRWSEKARLVTGKMIEAALHGPKN